MILRTNQNRSYKICIIMILRTNQNRGNNFSYTDNAGYWLTIVLRDFHDVQRNGHEQNALLVDIDYE